MVYLNFPLKKKSIFQSTDHFVDHIALYYSGWNNLILCIHLVFSIPTGWLPELPQPELSLSTHTKWQSGRWYSRRGPSVMCHLRTLQAYICAWTQTKRQHEPEVFSSLHSWQVWIWGLAQILERLYCPVCCLCSFWCLVALYPHL